MSKNAKLVLTTQKLILTDTIEQKELSRWIPCDELALGVDFTMASGRHGEFYQIESRGFAGLPHVWWKSWHGQTWYVHSFLDTVRSA